MCLLCHMCVCILHTACCVPQLLDELGAEAAAGAVAEAEAKQGVGAAAVFGSGLVVSGQGGELSCSQHRP